MVGADSERVNDDDGLQLSRHSPVVRSPGGPLLR